MNFRSIIFLFLPCLFLFACGEKAPGQTPEEARKVENDPAAPEGLVTLSDIPLYGNFADMQKIFRYRNDTTYVINFWATWCKPCVEELPFFEDLHEKFPNEKLKVILVSLDFPNKLEEKLVPFINENKLKSDVVVLLDGDYNNWIDQVNSDWDGAIPVTHIYRNETSEFVGRAFTDAKELSDMTATFLRK